MLDIIIRNGLIADGTGKKAYPGDIGIKDGKIVIITEKLKREAKETIDANKLVVAPGFIDSHSHSDTSFIYDERCQSKLFQGVTSEISGQCGHSAFPRSPEQAAINRTQSPESEEYYASESISEYVQKIKKSNKKMSTNLLPLTGHGNLREAVLGDEARPVTPEELARMKELLRNSMAEGAWGMSLGLGYAPGVSSNQDELNSLGEEVAAYGGIITSHMRNQGAGTPQSLEEMFSISRHSGVKVHISHFKVSGKANWGKAGEFIGIVHRNREAGIPVSVDVYPYRASASGITVTWPDWAIQGGSECAVERTRNHERPKLIEALSKRFQTPEDGDGLFIVDTRGLFPLADGKTLRQIAEALNMGMPEALLHVTAQTGARAQCISYSMCDEDVMRMLEQNDFVIGSDGYGYPLDAALCPGKVHPRNFGTFPRFLKLAREKRLCPLETAVHRITGRAAEIVGIHDRGVLRPGMAADITIFDWDKVADNATYEDPIKANDGIFHVIVNGETAIKDGNQTLSRSGKILLKK